MILGLNMVMRAVIIIVAVNGLVSTVPIDRLGDAVERLGLRDLGFAVGVAFNLLPLVQRALLTSWHVLRQRAGLRRPITAARLLLLAAVGHSLRCADEVALAAEARAYTQAVADGGEQQRSRPHPLAGRVSRRSPSSSGYAHGEPRWQGRAARRRLRVGGRQPS